MKKAKLQYNYIKAERSDWDTKELSVEKTLEHLVEKVNQIIVIEELN